MKIKALLFLYLILIVSLLSCSKSDSINNEDYSNDNIISFKVAGIDDDINRNASLISSYKQYNVKSSIGNYIAINSFNELNINNLRVDQKNAVSKMQSSNYYWLIVYRKDNNTVIFNQSVLASAGANVPVLRNVDYNWIAYSYNTSNESLLQDPVTLNNGIISEIKLRPSFNKEFIVANGSTKIINDNSIGVKQQPVNILFKHKTVRAKLTIDINQIQENPYIINTTSSPKLKVNIPSGVVYNGVYNFLNGNEGEYINSSLQSQQINDTDLVFEIQSEGSGDLSLAEEANKKQALSSSYIYSAKIDANQKFDFNVQSLYWKYRYDQSGQSLGRGSLPSNQVFEFNNLPSLELGKSYEFTINIKPDGTAYINELYWAQYNLQYKNSLYILKEDHSFPKGITRKIKTNGDEASAPWNSVKTLERYNQSENNKAIYNVAANTSDYFIPGRLNFTSGNSTYNSTADPCKQLEDGKWRLPKQSEYQALSNISSNNKKKNGYYFYSFLTSYVQGIEVDGSLLSFYPYGFLFKNDISSSSSIWYPNRFGYDKYLLYSSQTDLGMGVYLYAKDDNSGFGYVTFAPGSYSYNYINDISESESSNWALTVRCVRKEKRDIAYIK